MRTGLDVFLDDGHPRLDGCRIGLITNATAVDRGLRSGVDLLVASGRVRLVALFGPEHGVRGDAQAGVSVVGAVDGRTGLPMHSLYGETRRPTAGMLRDLDAVIFDLQDIGVRYATYLSTMVYAQEAAAEHGVLFAVFDRPNPITGSRVEGNVLDPAFASFVGVHPLPVRHGMTAGELSRLIASGRGWPEPLVVPMEGWRREQWFDETGLPWIQPSPNLPTLDSVTLYPGTCLIEGTNVSEGRGTTRPFEYVGAPWLDPFRLAAELDGRDTAGCAFRPVYFTPTFSKHAGRVCGGVEVHVMDRRVLRPVELGLHLLDAVRVCDPLSFAWRPGEDGSFFVDLLLGGDRSRRLLDGGTALGDVIGEWRDEATAFAERRRPFFLYPGPAPAGC